MKDTLAQQWQEALVQAAAPPLRFDAPPARALLNTAEDATTLPGASPPSLSDPFRDPDAGILCVAPQKRIRAERDAAAWLHDVAARANTLQERLAAGGLTAEPPENDDVVAARLRRWAAYIAPGADSQAALARFQIWEGLSIEEMARAVGPGPEDTPLPGWAATLQEALFEADYGDPLGACTARSPLPFETLHLPFVNIYRRRLLAAIPDIDALLAPVAQADLARGLLYVLAQMACEALYGEFQGYRLDGFAPLLSRISHEPDAVYRRFVVAMQAGRLRTFYTAYPVLARIQAVVTDLAVETAVEFLRRLRADLPEIRRHWRLAAPALVAQIADALGDRHRGGHRVMAITLSDGSTVIYKPKDLGIDIAYNGLLAWLNRWNAPVTLRPLARASARWVRVGGVRRARGMP